MSGINKIPDYRLMIEAIPAALILLDNIGKVIFINDYAAKLFHYRKNEITGKNFLTLIPERYHSSFSNFLSAFFANKEILSEDKKRDLFALKSNDEEIPVEVELNRIEGTDDSLVLATFTDITERDKANEQFRLMVESAPNSIILVDYTGHIVMVNRQTEILFGYERDELLGKRMEILVPNRLKANHPKLRNKFYDNPEARPMGAGRDLFGLRKDGTEIPIEIGLNPIEKDGSQFVLASTINITERKRNEEAIRLYTKRLEDKNNELEQFTYIASHDLREPLNSINSLIELFIETESHKLGEEALKQLEFITQSANRMKDLVKGLLDYARLGKNSDFQKINITEIVKQVENDLEIAIMDSGAKIKLTELPVLNAMEMEIRLLFQNLISNAIKYRAPNRVPEIEISAQKVKNGWKLAVSDNGIGIPADQYDKIFIIFQRLHGRNEYDGVGIGLSHCRKIVELHDGKIWVESAQNEGSTFYFFIPENN